MGETGRYADERYQRGAEVRHGGGVGLSLGRGACGKGAVGCCCAGEGRGPSGLNVEVVVRWGRVCALVFGL